MLAQASRPDAASRTRPFFANEDRLATTFPQEHQASIDALLDLLADDVPSRRDAEAIYHMTFGALHDALRRGAPVTTAETDHLVRFCIRGMGGMS